uniref:Cytochrome P450 n=1 Tax=Meloidogyne javanica TaxID=6303 RepID=A0A915M030_MELJA
MVKELLFDKFEYFHARALCPIIGDVDTNKLIHLFFAKGKRWKRLRSTANPAFSISNLKRVMPIIDDSIKININLLKEAESSGKFVDLHEYFVELAFDIIVRIAMGQKESKQFKSEYCQMARDSVIQISNNIFDYLAFIFPWLGENILEPFVKATGKLRGDPILILMGSIYKAVKQRKEEKMKKNEREGEEDEENLNNKKRVDFIDLFLESEAENNEVELKMSNGTYNKKEKVICVSMFERYNTLDEIVLNCSLFLLAGFDTTANSLSLIAHNLVIYPEVQKRLFEEIEEICGLEEGEIINYEQLAKLKYADAVFKETLRLCPIATDVVNRKCEETTTLGNITIEKGTFVSVDLFTLHRDKKIWGEDAEEFKPERWLLNENINTPTEYYYPFGGGPRICIGMRLALMEIKMILVHLLRSFELEKCSETLKPSLAGQAVLNSGKICVKLNLRK